MYGIGIDWDKKISHKIWEQDLALFISKGIVEVSRQNMGQKRVRICFMTSMEINREGLREIYPSLGLGCFIRKPVTIDYFLERIRSELD